MKGFSITIIEIDRDIDDKRVGDKIENDSIRA